MWNEPSKERLAKIPRLYETEHIPIEDKLIHLHFFIGGCDWYISEYDGEDLFFGFAILNNDLQSSEWGYVSFRELKAIKIKGWLEVDCESIWQVCEAQKIEKIGIAHGWIEDFCRENSEKDELRAMRLCS